MPRLDQMGHKGLCKASSHPHCTKRIWYFSLVQVWMQPCRHHRQWSNCLNLTVIQFGDVEISCSNIARNSIARKIRLLSFGFGGHRLLELYFTFGGSTLTDSVLVLVVQFVSIEYKSSSITQWGGQIVITVVFI